MIEMSTPAAIVFLLVILALAVTFCGEPDLHDKVIEHMECECKDK